MPQAVWYMCAYWVYVIKLCIIHHWVMGWLYVCVVSIKSHWKEQ